jgi:hypothetical protein
MWNDKPDGYLIPTRNPTGTSMNFYPRVWVRIQISICSLFADGWVIVLSDPNPTRYHPYSQSRSFKNGEGDLPSLFSIRVVQKWRGWLLDQCQHRYVIANGEGEHSVHFTRERWYYIPDLRVWDLVPLFLPSPSLALVWEAKIRQSWTRMATREEGTTSPL